MSCVALWYRAVFDEILGKYHEKLEIKSAICSIMVLSRFGDFHGKYREENEITRVMWSIVVPSRFCEIHWRKIFHEKWR